MCVRGEGGEGLVQNWYVVIYWLLMVIAVGCCCCHVQVKNALEVYLACDEEGTPGDGMAGFHAFISPG